MNAVRFYLMAFAAPILAAKSSIFPYNIKSLYITSLPNCFKETPIKSAFPRVLAYAN